MEVLSRVEPRLPPRDGPVMVASASTLPCLPRARSEPTLARGEIPGVAEAKRQRTEFRAGLSSLMEHLDAQCAARRQEHRRAQWAEKAKVAMRAQYRLALDASRAPERPDWTYTDAPGYFQDPQHEKGPSETFVKNKLLQGIYGVTDPRFKPPHMEDDECNTRGGWKAHANQALLPFGDKPYERMGPTERKYADKLAATLEQQNALAKRDAQLMTSGAFKKYIIDNSANEFSSLKRQKQPWNDQLVSTHVHFSSPEPYLPGEQQYETSMPEFIERAERGQSYARDIVAGDGERVSHWRPRATGGPVGTTRRLDKANELLTPAGVRKARAASSAALRGQRGRGP